VVRGEEEVRFFFPPLSVVPFIPDGGEEGNASVAVVLLAPLPVVAPVAFTVRSVSVYVVPGWRFVAV
jgi:hypothetical protein